MDTFLSERKEEYNTKLFKELYEATKEEDEKVELSDIESNLKKILPGKYIMNFNFIENMSKKIVR